MNRHRRERRARSLETALARLTLGLLIIYLPVETYVSWSGGLWNPFYLVDLIAMVLMFVGARRSLAARPRPAPCLLGFGYAWATCSGWRATAGRAFTVHEGGSLPFGSAELWGVGAATSFGLVVCGLCLWLIHRAGAVTTLPSAREGS